jgi:hypothetical protein
MPTKRKLRTRNRIAEELSPVAERYLLTGDYRRQGKADDHGFVEAIALAAHYDRLAAVWREVSEALLPEYVDRCPGKRPFAWWCCDSPRAVSLPGRAKDLGYLRGQLPEPRQRLGGIGTPAYEVLNIAPSLPFGLPSAFITTWQVHYYGGAAVGDAIDPNDPPRYESQASYLRRHRLFQDGEADKLTDADYLPETVLPEDDGR